MSSIVIVGASCVSGLALARQLRQSGFDVFAVIRSKVTAQELGSMGCHVCVADATERDQFERCLESVPTASQFVSFLGGHMTDGSRVPLQAYKNIVDGAKMSGASRFTMISSVGCGDSAGAVLWVFRRLLKKALHVREQAEAYLHASGLDWCVIRPGALPERSPATGEGVLVEDPHVMGAIHRLDLADIVFRALQSRQTLGKNLTAVDRCKIWKPFGGQIHAFDL